MSHKEVSKLNIQNIQKLNNSRYNESIYNQINENNILNFNTKNLKKCKKNLNNIYDNYDKNLKRKSNKDCTEITFSSKLSSSNDNDDVFNDITHIDSRTNKNDCSNLKLNSLNNSTNIKNLDFSFDINKICDEESIKTKKIKRNLIKFKNDHEKLSPKHKDKIEIESLITDNEEYNRRYYIFGNKPKGYIIKQHENTIEDNLERIANISDNICLKNLRFVNDNCGVKIMQVGFDFKYFQKVKRHNDIKIIKPNQNMFHKSIEECLLYTENSLVKNELKIEDLIYKNNKDVKDSKVCK